MERIRRDGAATWRSCCHPLRRRARVQHFSAMPYTEVPAFMRELREQRGMAARALEFAILTAARTGEVLGAAWAEVDLEFALWVIPATRTKSGTRTPGAAGSGSPSRSYRRSRGSAISCSPDGIGGARCTSR